MQTLRHQMQLHLRLCLRSCSCDGAAASCGRPLHRASSPHRRPRGLRQHRWLRQHRGNCGAFAAAAPHHRAPSLAESRPREVVQTRPAQRRIRQRVVLEAVPIRVLPVAPVQDTCMHRRAMCPAVGPPWAHQVHPSKRRAVLTVEATALRHQGLEELPASLLAPGEAETAERPRWHCCWQPSPQPVARQARLLFAPSSCASQCAR
mmetsp:Transcript_121137/g.210379  ORF Transcript_121137/g.210379 Transcript_121137/m.210379 type:complete len:205 (-) Transcript_121137:2063-2677(-)